MTVLRAVEPEHLAAARELMQEYVAAEGRRCCGLREFQPDLESFPEPYIPPSGSLLLALDGETPAGCVALKRCEDSVCEMKRLYVRPGARGQGIGRALVSEVLMEARRLGFRRIRLDTVPSMREAVVLYCSFGFRPAARFRDAPDPASLFFELELA